ncbi:MAG: hypothetical protein JXB62_12385, partial [Pirellulales bacterium]|nr:hypothetical protein [Pirellulales bacterium]
MGSRQLRIEPLEDRRLLSVDHILSVDPLPIVVGDTWRYFEGTEQPPAEWNQVAFDDSSWLSGPTGIGFSDDDDATVLDDMPDNYTSVYARRLFHVDDPAAVVSLILAMDYDDGFVAYLNGVEVARSNMAPGATNFDDTATGNHEATGTPERFDISAAADLLLPGVNVLAVQGHNVSLVSHDFSLIPSLFSPVTIYVDDNAPGDPGHGDPTVSDPLENGSQDHPFDAIAEAILAAHDGDTVVLLDGLYMGEGNRDLDFGGRAMIVRSENGPDDCIIDAQGTPADPHRGFVFHRGEGGDSVLQGVTITGGFACLGGGVATFQSSPTLIGCVLLFNSACYDGSGGGMNNQGGNPVVLNCTFLGNVAPEAAEGGGMANWSSSPRVIGCTFMDNMTDWGGGGGMFNDASSHPVVTDSTFLTNRSFGGYSSGKGGAVRNAGGNPSFVGCTFTDNSAEYGGAMDNKEGAPTITECAFTGNSARTGGAVRNTQSEAIITGCTFQGNHASGSGGALHNDTGSAPTLTNCSFLGNWVFADEGSNGGAVSNNRSHLTMVNCLMSGNWADVQIPDHGGGNGGALQNTEGDAALINCTLSGNGGLNAGGIHNDYRSTLELLNSIVFGNHDRDGTGESSQIGRRYDTSVAVDYSCIQGWTGDLGGAGNTGADPQFVDPDGADDTAGTDDDDLRLAAGSPCLDGGDEDAVPPGVTTDLDGNPRFVGMAVDMGAYEFPVPATGVIRGTKFHDLDGDGLQGPNEPGLEGWTIFLDGNENWQWDEGERTTVSDADGNYVFERLVPGRYQVGEVSQEGWQQTFPNPGPSEIRRINVTDDG